MTRLVYLDWNATTPPCPESLAAMRRALSCWGNPSSAHVAGREARRSVDEARSAVATLLGFPSEGVVITSGATEANNLVVRGLLDGLLAPAAIVAGAAEHPSVRRAVDLVGGRGAEVSWAPPDDRGVVSARSVLEAIARVGAPVALVTVGVANHETGAVNPIPEIAEVSHAAGALLHADASQAAGRLSPETWRGADLVTISGHKMRGPKGVGAIAATDEARALLRPVLVGGGQEGGLRPGTQDPVACAGLAAAAQRAVGGPSRYAALRPLRDRLEIALFAIGVVLGVPPLRNGGGPRAPHVSNLSWPGLRGVDLVAALDRAGVCVSSGSACSSGGYDPSPVIAASWGPDRAGSAVRCSLGEETTPEDVDEAARRWTAVLKGSL